MGARKHTHQYHKVDGVWACALPDCTHFMPQNVERQVIGKKSICWECVEPFIMDSDTMKRDKPICITCILSASPKMKEVLEDETDLFSKYLTRDEQK